MVDLLDVEVVLPMAIAGIVVLLVAIIVYYRIVPSAIINGAIQAHYQVQGFKVLEVELLNLSEKLRYGLPLNSFIGFYGVFLRPSDIRISYPSRKVVLTDVGEVEHICFVRLIVRRRVVVDIEELDRFVF